MPIPLHVLRLAPLALVGIAAASPTHAAPYQGPGLDYSCKVMGLTGGDGTNFSIGALRPMHATGIDVGGLVTIGSGAEENDYKIVSVTPHAVIGFGIGKPRGNLWPGTLLIDVPSGEVHEIGIVRHDPPDAPEAATIYPVEKAWYLCRRS